MGFSIRSELASYARLKRRCYFLFVISYGGLLAGLTYAAMTHQSPPLWIGLIPGAALSVPLLLLPTQSWLPCLFHVLLGVVFAPIICARREADLSLIEAVELGAVAGLALIYPFYILCSTLEKEGTTKNTLSNAKAAKKLGLKIIAVTSKEESELGALADCVIKVPGRIKGDKKTASIQLLSSLFDQSVHIVLDELCLKLSRRDHVSDEMAAGNHVNVE